MQRWNYHENQFHMARTHDVSNVEKNIHKQVHIIILTPSGIKYYCLREFSYSLK